MVDMLKNKDEKENKREENEGESTEENDKRPSCLYGKVGCTRKNPEHFIAEAHPGDDDYVEISQSMFCIIKQRTYFWQSNEVFYHKFAVLSTSLVGWNAKNLEKVQFL